MSKEHKFQTSMHLVLTVLHLVMTLAAFAISIAIVVFTLGANCSPSTCKSMIFITSTFFSSRQIETSYGWPVATERSQIGEVIQYPTDQDSYAFSHYYECMYTAQMADLVCPSLPNVNAYKACLHNNTATDAALTTCNALSSSNYVTHWPTTEEYTRCLFGHTAMRNSVSIRASQNVFKACVEKSLWPFFENQQTIDSNIPLGSFNWAIFISVGFIITTSFAVYTASWIEDGHVKFGEPQLFMRFGFFWSTVSFLWCLAFFAIFTVVAFNHTTAFENNQGVPTTVSTVFVTLGLLGTCLLYFGSEVTQSQYWVFRGSTFSSDAPDHLKRDHVEYSRERYAKIHKQRDSLTNSRNPHGAKSEPDTENGKQECGLRVPLQPANQELVIILSDEEVAKYYTPPLISTWADGYLADGCLFLGLAGATGQLTSDQSWNIFVLITLYRVLNMMITRFMYEAFMNNLCLGDPYNRKKFEIKNYPTNARMDASTSFNPTLRPAYDEFGHVIKDGSEEARKKALVAAPDPHLDIRVLGLSTQIAALYVFAAICFIVFDGNYALSDFGVFKLFFFLCFIFPETIRVVIHVWYQIRQTEFNEIPWALLNTHFFIWIWDLLFRIIGVSIVILGSNHEMQGTREYLVSHANTLMGDYLRVLGVSMA